MTSTAVIAFTSIGFLSLAAAMPARAQAAISADGPADRGPKDTAAIPDFFGRWAHPFYPSFELPLSGPGPVTNRSQRRQIFDADGRPRSPEQPLLVDNPDQLVGDYTNPILKADAAEIVKKHGELELSRKGYRTPLTECWPTGVPFIFF
jgi:hypothetical protein